MALCGIRSSTLVRGELLRNQQRHIRGTAVDGNVMNAYIYLPLTFPAALCTQFKLFVKSLLRFVYMNIQHLFFSLISCFLVTSWKKWIFGVFVRLAGWAAVSLWVCVWTWCCRKPELALLEKGSLSFHQTCCAEREEAKGKLFKSAVQEQQKTLPVDCVVENGYGGRGYIWQKALTKGGELHHDWE